MPIVDDIKDRYLKATGKKRLLAESERKWLEEPPKILPSPDPVKQKKLEEWSKSKEREI